MLWKLYFLLLPLLVEGFSEPHISTPIPASTTASSTGKVHRRLHKNAPGTKDTPSQSKPVYFDLTDALDKKSFSEIENALNSTSHVYYSTDRLLTEILDLSWVIDTLKAHYPSQNEETASSICLTVSFQMTKNRSKIDWRHMEDVLYTIPFINGTEDERLQVMKQHLCGIILDFQLGNDSLLYIDTESFGYAEKWDLSFTKYAKKIMSTIFGNDVEEHIPVGVAYNERQLDEFSNIANSSKILLEQELQHADFLIVNLEFSPIERMPMGPRYFTDHLKQIWERNERFLGRSENANTTTSAIVVGKDIDVMYMLTWREPYLEPGFTTPTSAYNQVLNSSRALYLDIFKAFALPLLKLGISKIEIISGTYFDVDNYRPELERRGHLIPYLYMHEVDTTPCQLIRMMDKTLTMFSTLVVNEFTWSALAHNEEIISNPETQKCDGRSRRPPHPSMRPIPKKAILFASKGIGLRWNQTKRSFKNLLTDHMTIGKLNLTSVIFSADDLSTSPGIPAFVNEWTRENMSEVGCLVDLYSQRWMVMMEPYDMIRFMEHKCQPILDKSSVIVFRYTINHNFNYSTFENLMAYDFGFEFGKRTVKRSLFNLLVAREMMKARYPGATVIIQVDVKEDKANVIAKNMGSLHRCNAASYDKVAFEKVLIHWADIHGVKLVIGPLYDVRYPSEGIWKLPGQNGTLQNLGGISWDCVE